MAEILSILSEGFAIRGLITSCMVGVMCGVLGTFLVLKNMSLIGDALSHAILPGVFVAFIVIGGISTAGFFIGCTIAGLIAALSIAWIQQNIPTKSDAAIGIIFTAMFSIGVIGISYLSRLEGGVHIDMQDFLFGSVLGISDEDMYLTFGIMCYTILSVVLFYRYLFITTFQATIAKTMGIPAEALHYFIMLLLSLVVVSSLAAVGVILVVAMLVTPAATALLLSNKLKVVILLSAVIGMIASFLGMVVAVVFDFPPGPSICVSATAIYFIAVLFSPENGLIFKGIRNYKEANRIEREDIVKYLLKNKGSNIQNIGAFLGITSRKMKSLVNDLKSSGLVSGTYNNLVLSDSGITQANELVRAHRLWETYQVEAMGVAPDKIHLYAENMEHHLSKDILSEIEEKLGYPTEDPHGSPIPPRKN